MTWSPLLHSPGLKQKWRGLAHLERGIIMQNLRDRRKHHGWRNTVGFVASEGVAALVLGWKRICNAAASELLEVCQQVWAVVEQHADASSNLAMLTSCNV